MDIPIHPAQHTGIKIFPSNTKKGTQKGGGDIYDIFLKKSCKAAEVGGGGAMP